MVEEIYSGKLRKKVMLYKTRATANVANGATADIIDTGDDREAFLTYVYIKNNDGTNAASVVIKDHAASGDVEIASVSVGAGATQTLTFDDFPIWGTLQISNSGASSIDVVVVAKVSEKT